MSDPAAATVRGPRHAWVDGRLLPAGDRHLSAFDRGFQLGDGVFETIRAHAGRAIELDEHLERLGRSADGLAIELPSGVGSEIERAIGDLLAAEGLAGPDAAAAIRITVSRGAMLGRGLLPTDEVVAPTLVVQAWPIESPPAGHLEGGLHLVASAIRRDPANPLVALKTTSRADYVVARLEARRAGADDALFLTLDGRLSEATSANVFLVRRGAAGTTQLATPALDSAVLPGTTRSWLLAWAGEVGLEPVETALQPGDLVAADEAFLSSSVAGILPLTRYEGHEVGAGRPGPRTQQAREAREAFIRAGGSR